MPRAKLTDPLLRSLRANPPKKRQDLFDTAETGLVARVSPKGTIAFLVRYRLWDEQRRHPVGHYPDVTLRKARLEAKRVVGMAAVGEDPREERASRDSAFSSVAKRYLEKWARPNKKTWREDERIIERELVPVWKRRPVSEIRRRDIRRVLERIIERGSPVMANRTQALIHRIFEYAIEEELLELSPAAGMKRLHKERPSEKSLSDDELRRVYRACEADGTSGARALQVLALTGQRSREVTSARDEERTDQEWWEIPASRTKNGRAHLVYLAPETQRVLNLVQREPNNPHWFPGKKPGTPIHWLAKTYQRISRSAGVEFTPKDLRATFTTGLSKLRIPQEVKAACLNHTPTDVTSRHYDKWHYSPEKKQAFKAWAAELLTRG